MLRRYADIGAEEIAEALKDEDDVSAVDEAAQAAYNDGTATIEKKLDEAIADALAMQRAGDMAIENFGVRLKESARAAEEQGAKAPLFVLIDELDRCRPTYAIALLERVKHLFEVDGVVFLIATDTKQLVHSINAVYGAEFDARRYLDRFFEQTYRMSEPSVAALVEQFVEQGALAVEQFAVPGDMGSPGEALRFIFDAFDTVPRDVNAVLDQLGRVQHAFPFPCTRRSIFRGSRFSFSRTGWDTMLGTTKVLASG